MAASGPDRKHVWGHTPAVFLKFTSSHLVCSGTLAVPQKTDVMVILMSSNTELPSR